MAKSSPDPTELIKQLLEDLAIGRRCEDQAAVIAALKTESSETRAAIESSETKYDQITAQQALSMDQISKRFDDVSRQLLAIPAIYKQIQDMQKQITDLKRENMGLRAADRPAKDNLTTHQLQVVAQDALHMCHEGFPDSSAASQEFLQEGEIEAYGDGMLTDPDAAIEPEESPSDPDVSMTLNTIPMPEASVYTPRYEATPEYSMPPTSFFTPKNLVGLGVSTPGSVKTAMPDTVGFHRYNGPWKIPQDPLFAESLETDDQNFDKRPKRARRPSVAPPEILALSPITEATEVPEPEHVTGLEKNLFREAWQNSGKLDTIEDYVRKQKLIMLSSDVDGDKGRSRRRYTASDFDEIPSPQEPKPKRARYQPKTAISSNAVQPLQQTNSMLPPASFWAGRPSRATKIPGRFGSKDVLTGKDFMAATKARGGLPSSQAGNGSADPTQKSVNASSHDDEESRAPANAASILLQQFGSRKFKTTKGSAK